MFPTKETSQICFFVVFGLFLSSLLGCKVVSTGPPPPTLFDIKQNQATIQISLSETSAMNIKSDRCYEIEVPFFEGKAGVFSVADQPNSLTLDPANGKLIGCPTEPGLFSQIIFSVKQADQVTIKSKPYAIEVLGDPLAAFAWHLKNWGQSSFAFSSGTSGEDMKVHEATRMGLTGAGVEIAISDSGLDILHEDLADNILAGKSYNYVDQSSDPTLEGPHNGDHGTSVAGIIGAVGWNGKGSRGIAPGAKIAGLNLLSPKLDLNGQTAAFYDHVTRDFDIINQSWGVSLDYWAQSDTSYESLLKYAVNNFREKKGTIFVKAAGNKFPSDAAFDPDQRNPYKIIVGGLDATGKRASYSSTGANLWISGLAGEYGFDSEAKALKKFGSGSNILKPAFLTTDATGCTNGFSRASLNSNYTQTDFLNFFKSLFNYDVSKSQPHSQNPNCDYTSTFNGTSAAAPSISGIVALILEKNPNLSWRDVKHILANTADKVDSSSSLWITNAAVGDKKYHFNPEYGFGRANASAAVELAGKYTDSWGPFENWQSKETPNLPIPEGTSLERQLMISNNTSTPNLVIEAVQLFLDIDHPNPNQLQIDLVSPGLTPSLLLNTQSGNTTAANLPQISLLANAFYGESSVGTWKLTIQDKVTGSSGQLKSWGVKVYGHRP